MYGEYIPQYAMAYSWRTPNTAFRQTAHGFIHFFRQRRQPLKHVVPALDAAFLPDPAVLIGVGLKLGAVYVGMLQIHVPSG